MLDILENMVRGVPHVLSSCKACLLARKERKKLSNSRQFLTKTIFPLDKQQQLCLLYSGRFTHQAHHKHTWLRGRAWTIFAVGRCRAQLVNHHARSTGPAIPARARRSLGRTECDAPSVDRQATTGHRLSNWEFDEEDGNLKRRRDLLACHLSSPGRHPPVPCLSTGIALDWLVRRGCWQWHWLWHPTAALIDHPPSNLKEEKWEETMKFYFLYSLHRNSILSPATKKENQFFL